MWRGCRIVLALLVSHRAKLWASTITHPCVCGRWGRRILAPTLCDRHRASMHDPQVAGSPSRRTKKSRAMPVCGSGSVAGCRIAVVGVGASLRRLCATAIVHPCTTRKLRVLPPAAPKIMPRLLSGALFLVPMAGVEPARYCYQRILSPSRLPIPSHRLIKMCCKTALHNGNNDFTV